MKQLFFILIYFGVFTIQLKSQDIQPPHLTLTLDQAIELAQQQSLASFKSRNMYLSRYWSFRSFKADRLPALSLNATPVAYDNSARLRYSEKDSADVYIRSQTLKSSVGLILKQNISLTGGSVDISSDLNRSDNIAQNIMSNTSTPFSIGFSQPLSGYNEFRWEARIEPIKFEKAKRDYVHSVEDIAMQTVDYFFRRITAEINLQIANTNYQNADTLYRIANGRFNIGTVTRDELLDFELGLLNSKIELSKSNQTLLQAKSQLVSFLGLSDGQEVECVAPNNIVVDEIKVEDALNKAVQNNSQVWSFQQQHLEASQNVAIARSKSALGASLSGRVGYSKTTPNYDELYTQPFDQDQSGRLTLSIPILDWGKRHGQIQMAKASQQETEVGLRQSRIDFEQRVIQQIMEYNILDDQVLISAKADTVAQLGFEVTKQRFLIDKVDVLKLNAARNSVDAAKRNYVDALKRYWNAYYNVRKLTLFDFNKGVELMDQMDKTLERPDKWQFDLNKK